MVVSQYVRNDLNIKLSCSIMFSKGYGYVLDHLLGSHDVFDDIS